MALEEDLARAMYLEKLKGKIEVYEKLIKDAAHRIQKCQEEMNYICKNTEE